jgi:membrane protease YdiL (CAAX protease family)
MAHGPNEESALSKFIGVRRWKELYDTFREESNTEQNPKLSTKHVIIALVVSLAPICIASMDAQTLGAMGSLPTIAFGISTLLAIVLRSRFELAFQTVRNWRQELSLTHTAFALGCIPAVFFIALNPQLLAERHDLIAVTAAEAARGPATLHDILVGLAMLLFIAAWVAFTEEFIFRGLLVSVVRRWNLAIAQNKKDIIAMLLSAGIFGAAHYATWGIEAAAALTGIGFGFAIAYIANKERIMTLVLYHFIFDILSLLASIL